MSKNLTQALEAVREWHAKQEAKAPALPNLEHGDRVHDMAGDGSLLFIDGFERTNNEEYQARCLKLGTDKVEMVPVSRLKLSHQTTIH